MKICVFNICIKICYLKLLMKVLQKICTPLNVFFFQVSPLGVSNYLGKKVIFRSAQAHLFTQSHVIICDKCHIKFSFLLGTNLAPLYG